ncbi:hypothetical protein ACFQH6_08635 [Halobacteriaceae archaeon GCM10025711]
MLAEFVVDTVEVGHGHRLAPVAPRGLRRIGVAAAVGRTGLGRWVRRLPVTGAGGDPRALRVAQAAHLVRAAGEVLAAAALERPRQRVLSADARRDAGVDARLHEHRVGDALLGDVLRVEGGVLEHCGGGRAYELDVGRGSHPGIVLVCHGWSRSPEAPGSLKYHTMSA